MEPQQPRPQRHRPSHPHPRSIILPPPSQFPNRTSNNTPVSSPGLFSPTLARGTMSFPPSQQGSESATPASLHSPYLHPLHGHKVRETHKANVEHDNTTGRKHINNYEIIEELGRGMHGKVKLARNSNNGEYVAIKIIPRFSKRRRLGKVMAMSTQDKSKREIAILKKIRHDNVVALLEIIDDPEMKKIYMVLEHVELGEVVWRKKGLPHICEYERRRVEREMRGEKPTPGEERFERLLEQRQALRDAERATAQTRTDGAVADYWSLEYGPADGEESRHGSFGSDAGAFAGLALSTRDSVAGSRATSRAPSRTRSAKSVSDAHGLDPIDSNTASIRQQDDTETPGGPTSNPNSSAALDGTVFAAYPDDPVARGRSPTMQDSIMSHISSLDYTRVRDPYVDDFSYVPCFTMDEARVTFRDTVLGLEYLHYEGVVHRDIKPANLLWTRDKKTKIADFGVSYFGRPARDGEPDDTISESEARDFDNDLELAKTVGTPAFFAPELCATDLHDVPPGTQPKINEQIDVWSLGVTLFCLVFARIPFLAEDEWQMFKKIANEDVFIPKRRLRPVDPATKPSEKSLYTRVNKPPYRDDDELAYEEIDGDLQDLLSKMLTKNPDKRIRLRDVKRHDWVTKGLDPMGWIDDTDPSRRTSGKKIQVDERDITQAVVPLSFIDRARSTIKKVVGKVMHPRGERGESVSSRRRAASSAASSAGDNPVVSGLTTPHSRDARRRSLRPDDYFSSPSQPSTGHPLTHSVLASPQDEHPPPLPQQSSAGGQALRLPLELLTHLATKDERWARQASASPHRMTPRHGHARSLTNTFLPLTPTPIETQTPPPTPLFDNLVEDPSSALGKARDTKPAVDDLGRARSVDRGLFASNDKRAAARVSLSTAVAPGNVHFPYTPGPRPTRSIEFAKRLERAVSSASSTAPFSSSPLKGYQHGYFKSDPSMHNRQRVPVDLYERPMTSHRLIDGVLDPEPELIPCPPSPDDAIFCRMSPSRAETIATGKSSSSSASMGGLTTALTSPCEPASPIYGLNTHMTKEVTDQMLAFQSDPSLPALLSSSTSSVSADPEGEFLGNPGLVGRSSVTDTTDSLTPPAFAKESMSGFPLDVQDAVLDGAVSVKFDVRRRHVLNTQPLAHTHAHAHHLDNDDEDSDSSSDSDDGLVMMAARPKKK
ncbi:kinase-like protein, partial [Trichocladium antarcticum]